MASFGETLRRERELRGVTLAELAAATKISVRYLSALEGDQFDRLPGGVFNRGFVRAVARYLGLDEYEWIGAFAHAAHEEPEVLARYAPPATGPDTARQSGKSFVLLVILFGAALLAVYSVRARRAADTIPALAGPARTTPAPAKELATTPSERVVTAARVSAENATPVNLPTPAPPERARVDLYLQVDAIEAAWVSVDGDSRTLYEGLMKPGETRVFRAVGELALRTGNASALVLTLNGETLAPLGNPGEVKSITLTRKDLASLPP